MDAAHQALQNPDIARSILSFLRWEDLDACMEVCKTWAEEVDALRKSRPPVMFTLEGDRVEVDGMERNPPALSVVCVRSKKSQYEEIRRRIRQHLGPVMICVLDVFRRTRLSEYRSTIRGISVPRIDGVQVDIVQYSLDDAASIWDHLSRILIKNIIKCVMIFAHFDLYAIYAAMMSFISNSQPEEPNFAIGGGAFDGFNYAGERHKDITYLVIFGVPKSLGSHRNFKAFSNILPANSLKRKDRPLKLENDFKLMFEQVSLLKHSVIFKFGGLIRTNVEDELFEKYFPTISTIRVMTRQEFGIEHYPALEDELLKKCSRTDIRYHVYQESLSLVILTWNE